MNGIRQPADVRHIRRCRQTLLDAGLHLGVADTQSLLDTWKRIMKLSGLLLVGVPKTHLMLHCILRSRYLGNPVWYQCFVDESLNSTLKQVLRLCHQYR